jgi:hypothetical protein
VEEMTGGVVGLESGVMVMSFTWIKIRSKIKTMIKLQESPSKKQQKESVDTVGTWA